MKFSNDLRSRLREVIEKDIKKSEDTAVVKTAHDISDDIKKEIVSKVSHLKGKNISFERDPSILAGFIAEIGSTKHDYSLRSRILDQFQSL